MTEPEILLGFRFFSRFNRGNRSGELEREVLPRARVVTRARAVNFRALFRPQTTLLTRDLLVSLDWLPSFAHCSLVIKSSGIEIILKTVFWSDSELQKKEEEEKEKKERKRKERKKERKKGREEGRKKERKKERKKNSDSTVF